MRNLYARRPPMALAAVSVAAGWGAIYCVGKWLLQLVLDPVHEDVRLFYVAAEAGRRYGWSRIYDQDTLRALSSSFPPGERQIDAVLTYIHPPLLAWIFAPLTVFPEPVAYMIWAGILLAALVVAWYVSAPYAGLAKLTLLLAALALWPMLTVFYFGQPVTIVMALLALAWWLTCKERPVAAGAMVALATFLKPQDMLLVPAALLVSGHFRVVAGWAAGCVGLAVGSAVALGPEGLMGWWGALQNGQASSSHLGYTLAHALGLGVPTFALWFIQGAAALVVAFRQRRKPEIVFAAGILGSVTVAFHFHLADYSVLVLAAWLVLRSAPPVWHRLWMVVGFTAMQVTATSLGAPIAQLVWDASWLAILMVDSLRRGDSPVRLRPADGSRAPGQDPAPARVLTRL